MTYIRVEKAVYEGDYKVKITFSDATEQVVDFESFLIQKPHPQYNKYLDKDLFSQFTIDMDNVVWGTNWDLIFPVDQLYHGAISG